MLTSWYIANIRYKWIKRFLTNNIVLVHSVGWQCIRPFTQIEIHTYIRMSRIIMLLWKDKINIYYISDPANNFPYLVYISWAEILYCSENEYADNPDPLQYLQFYVQYYQWYVFRFNRMVHLENKVYYQKQRCLLNLIFRI